MSDTEKMMVELNSIVYDLDQIAGRLQALVFKNEKTVGASAYGDYKRRIDALLYQLKGIHQDAIMVASDMKK